MRVFTVLALTTSAAFTQTALRFEANQGQADPSTRYLGRSGKTTVTFSDDAVRFSSIALRFAGADQNAPWETAGPLPSTSSYFRGNDPARWISAAPHYARLQRQSVYRGIDVQFHDHDGTLEFDFALAPHADPHQIRLSFDAAAGFDVTPSGDLQVSTRGQTVVLHHPQAYQLDSDRRVEIACRFLVDPTSHEAHFELGAYDRSLPLTIDPVVDTISLYGGPGEDRISAVLPNAIAGVTSTAAHGKDIFLWQGNYYYVYGGSGDEEPTAATVSGNQVVIAGWTTSRDLPTSATAAQRTYGGGARDGFYIVTGYSDPLISYLGGSQDDAVLAIAADPALPAGGFYLAGETMSADFPTGSATQAALAGGKDGFVTRITSRGTLAESTYFGGSGDDSVLAIDATAASCWIAGRTTSADLPQKNGPQPALAGGSDGFLARFDRSVTALPALAYATYYGGTGDDDVRALRIAPDGWVWAAGTTASADLPVTRAAQPVLAGDTDGWVTRLHPRTGAASFATYLGGSGHDEITAITHDGNGDLYLAGWTNSTDLRLQDPLQDRSGGDDDGLLARIDADGAVQMLSYFGGAGKDRFRALALTQTGALIAAGESDSHALPPLTATAPVALGGTDGLYVVLHQNGIYANDLVIGKDLTDTLTVRVIADDPALPVTIRSTDPSLVTVQGGSISANGPVEVRALADSGQAEIVISAPGLPARHVTVRLRPSYLVNPYGAGMTIPVNSTANLNFATATVHPDSGETIYQNPPSQFDPGLIFDVDHLETIQVRGNYNFSAAVRAVGAGTATFMVRSAHFPLLGGATIPVNVPPTLAPTLSLVDPVVGRYLQTPLQLTLAPSSFPVALPAVIRLTSEDTSLVRLSLKSTDAGTDSVSLTYSQSFNSPPVVWLQGRADSGTARVRVEVDGGATTYVNVRLAPAMVALATPAQTVNLLYFGTLSASPIPAAAALDLWSTRTLFAVYPMLTGPAASGFTTGSQSFSPEKPLTLAVRSSNAAVIPGFDGFMAAGLPWVAFNVTPLREGATSLSVDSADFPSAGPVAVTVRPRSLRFPVSEVTLGKDTTSYFPFQTPFDFPTGVTITVTSSDPSKLLVGRYQSDESASTAIPAMPGGIYNGDGFWYAGLAASGDVTVTLSAPGFGSQTLLVHLAPTLFTLSPLSQTVAAGSYGFVYVTPTYPNAPTFIALRASFHPTFALASSDPAVARIGDSTLASTGVNFYAQVLAVAPGTAQLTLTSPSGAALAPNGSHATFTAGPGKSPVAPQTIVLGKNLQRALFDSPPNLYNVGKLTVRSLDPSRVLLSRDPLQAGVEKLDYTGTLYVQALADSGDVMLSVTADGLTESLLRVRLCPTVIGFVDPYQNTQRIAASTGSLLTLRVGAVPVDPDSGNPVLTGNYSLRGGLDAFEVKILTTNPDLGRVFSPLGFAAGMTSNTTQFRPDSNGTTELSVAPAEGFAEGGALFHRVIQVGGAPLTLASITLGKDMQYYHQLSGIAYNTPAFPVTITSSDPARVLLADTNKAVGAASVTVPSNQPFYVNALDSAGDVTLTATAVGMDPATANVHLEPSYFSFTQLPFTNSGQTGSIRSTLTATVYLTHPSYIYPSNKFLRPGAGPVTVPVTSSNDAIMTPKAPLVFPEGYNSFNINLATGEAGTANLRLGVPPGFVAAPDADRNLPITVQLRTFDFGFAFVGKDRQVNFGAFRALDFSTTVHLASGDPSRVLFSLDPAAPGTGELTFPSDPKNPVVIYAQALGDTGDVPVTATAEGFRPYAGSVRLSPSGYMFTPSNLSLIAGKSGTVTISTSDRQPLRPGAGPALAAIDNSDSTVAGFTPVTFQDGEYSKTFTVTGKAPGTAVLTLRNRVDYTSYYLVVTVTSN